VKPFAKILIANRGEIACRVIRTARDMGYRTVAVHSDADAGALQVRMADEAVRIGPPPVRESYLDIAALLGAARATGADAVHPGYGFLSENADFARACVEAGLVFIGPSPEAIHAMGNKAAAKRLMIAAGVPCVPGYEGADQSDATLMQEAARIGLPIMVKAAAGGGGRGMRLVTEAKDLAKSITAARSEAANAFGSGELILEKAVIDARHVEVQVFGDTHGNVIHLGERDCSVQRRHQKVLEEAPSPAVDAGLRATMGAAAVAAAKAVNYFGAGTVEFLLDKNGAFYFLEMNTRLQVEHPVTEMVTGLDLVEWQLRVAAGETLPLSQDQVRIAGHAIEARLYAEDPSRNFLPQSGTIVAFEPAARKNVRTDHGISSGWTVSPYYDPMLAKVIAYGATREEARRRLVAGLEDTLLLGLADNRAFLVSMLNHSDFAAGAATTSFIGTRYPAKSPALARPAPTPRLLALAAILFADRQPGASRLVAHWNSTGASSTPLRLTIGDAHHPATVRATGRNFVATIAGEDIPVSLLARDGDRIRFVAGGVESTARVVPDKDAFWIAAGATAFAVRETSLETARAGAKGSDANMLAPMNGRIVAVLAKAGESVSKGQRIVILEAMKMQHEIVAPRDGALASVNVREGDQVATRQVLAAMIDTE
jgi:geranyl-CoA carboxylase alpha subunit